MQVRTFSNSRRGRLRTRNFVNRKHELFPGTGAWFLCLPHILGGFSWPEHVRGANAAFHLMQPNSWFSSMFIRPGGYGAIHFDGNVASSYLDAGNPTYANLLNTSYTVSCWFRFDSAFSAGKGNQRLMSKGTGAANYTLIADNGTGKLAWSVNSGTAFTSTNSWTASTWYHFAVVYNGSTMSVYLNGVPQTTGTAGGGLTGNPNTNLIFGNQAAIGSTQVFAGCLDDVRFELIARSAEEIAAIYENSTLSYPGLLNRWTIQDVMPQPKAAPASGLLERRRRALAS